MLEALYRGDEAGVEALRPPTDELDLYEAAALGEADRVRAILAQDPEAVRTLSPDGFTPLHLAAFFGRVETVDVLLRHEAPVETYAEASFAPVTPLGSAAAAGMIDVARILLDAGADVNARGRDGGFTALHAAAQGGNVALAELLLERGADRDVSTDDGTTPLDLAATDEVRALLR